MSTSEIGALIRAARILAGYPTVYAFCKHTGISPGQMHGLEAGVNSPSIDTLRKVFGAIDPPWEVIVAFQPAKK